MNLHILTQAVDKKTVRVVFHIPVPGTTNTAGITWRAAVVKELGGADAIVSVLPELVGTQEETDLKSGALVEVEKSMRFSSLGLTAVQKLNEVKAMYTSLSSMLISEKQVTLDFMGYAADV